jgi:hypothetical protein
MEKSTFNRVSLSNVRVIMAIMHVLIEELLYHAVMGWALVLECPLRGVCGLLRLHPVMSGIKWHCFPSMATGGARVRVMLGYEEELQRADKR